MSNFSETLSEKSKVNFCCYRQNGLLLVPRQYIKIGPGYNLDYETPSLLCCSPKTRHQQHQQALIEFAQTIYKNIEIPKDKYFQEWSKLFTENTHGFKKIASVHYGLTFQIRGPFGDLPPQPLLRYNSLL
jgi:hypothetical protein